MPDTEGTSPVDAAAESLNSRQFYILLLFVSVIGAIGALMMIIFFVLEDLFDEFLGADYHQFANPGL